MSLTFVVDNSVVMSWCFEDETNDYADAILDSFDKNNAIVPGVWSLEIGNVLVAAERKKRLAMNNSVRFLSLISDLPLIVVQESPERMRGEILSLAREQGLSTYDASYLDLALRRGVSLATLDVRLRKAADRCGVPIYLQMTL